MVASGVYSMSAVLLMGACFFFFFFITAWLVEKNMCVMCEISELDLQYSGCLARSHI